MKDWELEVSLFLSEAARERNWDLQALTKKQQRELLSDLKQRGGFHDAHAVQLVGKLLAIAPDAVLKTIAD